MSAQSARAIDFGHLDAYTGGDQDLIREVLRLFKGQISTLIDTLGTAEDAKTWRETAHGIKGASRGIGAWQAADAAADLEQTDFANVMQRFAALGRLSSAYAEVEAEIERELTRSA